MVVLTRHVWLHDNATKLCGNFRQTRYSIVIIVGYMFQRPYQFRVILIKAFQVVPDIHQFIHDHLERYCANDMNSPKIPIMLCTMNVMCIYIRPLRSKETMPGSRRLVEPQCFANKQLISLGYIMRSCLE